MEENKIYKIENEPNLLEALQSDLADIMADQTRASQLLHRANDKAFDLTRKLIAIKKSNDTNTSRHANKEEAGLAGQEAA